MFEFVLPDPDLDDEDLPNIITSIIDIDLHIDEHMCEEMSYFIILEVPTFRMLT